MKQRQCIAVNLVNVHAIFLRVGNIMNRDQSKIDVSKVVSLAFLHWKVPSTVLSVDVDVRFVSLHFISTNQKFVSTGHFVTEDVSLYS